MTRRARTRSEHSSLLRSLALLELLVGVCPTCARSLKLCDLYIHLWLLSKCGANRRVKQKKEKRQIKIYQLSIETTGTRKQNNSAEI